MSNHVMVKVPAQKLSTVKFVYNDQPRNPKFVAIVDRWSLYKSSIMLLRLELGLQNDGRCR